MSHRCSLCDFSPNTSSIYNEGLTHVGFHRNHLLRDGPTEYICAECAAAIDLRTPVPDAELFDIEDDDTQEFQGFTTE